MCNSFSVAGPNSKYKLPNAYSAVFLTGLWHGLILPITFLISLFNPDIRIYETNNNGVDYDFGFLLGILSTFASTRN